MHETDRSNRPGRDRRRDRLGDRRRHRLGDRRDRRRDRSRDRRTSLRAAALAGLIAALSVTAGDAGARIFPFGPHHRAVNDLNNQFIPFHARLWDLLHGRAEGGLLLNWQSGWGTSFLPDLGTYLTSPFAPLVALFPRDRIDLAVYLVGVLKTGVAAAAMTWLLLTLRRGGPRWWAAGVLGASYALCGWSVTEAAYNPMWLDGLIAFPLLCLVGEWVLRGRRPVLGPLVVAVAWTANFYTAYMATLGAALVLLVRLVTAGGGVREAVRVLVRAAGATVLGIALAAPVLVPVFLGSRHAHPGWVSEFRAAGWEDVLARALPATYDFFTPAVFVGTGTLLAAAALCFHRAVPVRERCGWAGLAVAVALSFQWEPTHLAWHVFQTPNGSPYRQTFVLAGVLVIAAWQALAPGWPGVRALLGGAGLLGLLALGALGSGLAGAWSHALFGAGLLAAGGALLLARRGRAVPLAALLLAGALAGQAAATTAYADRARLGRLDDYPAWGAPHDGRFRAVSDASGWPAYRTDPGRMQLSGNDPLLLGGEGGAYYSSHTPAVLTRTMAALGAGWTSRGRSLQSLDNPVTDAVFAVGARARGTVDGPVRVTRAAVPPLVTVRPAGTPRFGPSPFRNQELLLGARVYEDPAPDGSCRPGTGVYLWAPDYNGTVRLAGPGRGARGATDGVRQAGRGGAPAAPGAVRPTPPGAARGPAGATDGAPAAGRPVRMIGGRPRYQAALQPLGASPGPGSRVVFDRPAPREWSVGCLDRSRLAAAVARLRATGAVRVEVRDDGVRAHLPPGSTGTAVLAAPRIAGWRCGDAPAGAYLGLVATPVRGTVVDCTFRPPGLRAGAAVGGAGALLLALAAVRRRMPRPSGRPLPGDDTRETFKVTSKSWASRTRPSTSPSW
ncbi:YfhO family protein [Streptomyces sp. NPDC101118]|uniref:YfhO family protein n=1 Tax=Streptomyces sp. NPDC101118 TaxID=3366109 RepID=UPI0038135609